MNEAMPDAAPLTERFLASLCRFLEHQHGGPGEGDISPVVKQAIAQQEVTADNPLPRTKADSQDGDRGA